VVLPLTALPVLISRCLIKTLALLAQQVIIALRHQLRTLPINALRDITVLPARNMLHNTHAQLDNISHIKARQLVSIAIQESIARLQVSALRLGTALEDTIA
jgi:hypothetical protein